MLKLLKTRALKRGAGVRGCEGTLPDEYKGCEKKIWRSNFDPLVLMLSFWLSDLDPYSFLEQSYTH